MLFVMCEKVAEVNVLFKWESPTNRNRTKAQRSSPWRAAYVVYVQHRFHIEYVILL